jgi:gas vesicle protein
MPRVTHVKKARKDNPVCKAGESYYWWKFRYGGKHYSLTRPRPSQLTQSAYYSGIRGLMEQIEDTEVNDNDDFTSLRDEVSSELETIRDECQENLDNMPEQLQDAPTGELLQERIDACENAQSEVECADEFDEEEPDIDDYDQDCPDCDGTGDNPDYDEDDPDDDKDCSTCSGTGEGVIKEEYHDAVSEYKERLDEWSSTVKDELSSAVGDCEV